MALADESYSPNDPGTTERSIPVVPYVCRATIASTWEGRPPGLCTVEITRSLRSAPHPSLRTGLNAHCGTGYARHCAHEHRRDIMRPCNGQLTLPTPTGELTPRSDRWLSLN